VFGLLMALLVLTVSLSFVPMHGWEKVPAYVIAGVKAVLVILFFMEVRHASRLTWIFAGAAFLWLGIMMVLSASDYATRAWTPGGERLSHVEPLIPPPSK
jgi:cytochrome c oxidase subunit IV